MFLSREDAGRRLGMALRQEGVKADLVLGLPRGGVIVAAEVAHALGLALDVLIVRKIGHPFQREFALGALAEGDVVVLDHHVVAQNAVLNIELQNVIEEEKARLAEYERKFHMDRLPDLAGKTVILVDDGLATGATTEAAVQSARQRGAIRVLIAAPVASSNAVQRLSRVADEVHVLITDPEFDAVGRYYHAFYQTDDEDVIDLLRAESRRHA